MSIGYVRIPHFAIAVARRDNPTLAEHPLLLGEEGAGHVAVYAGCTQALACGVQPGMSLARAQRLCPEAHLAPAAESAYLAAFEACLDTLGLFAPKVEPEGLGSAYLDLEDVVRNPDEATDLHRQLARQLQRDQQLAASMGITATMFGATVAGPSEQGRRGAEVRGCKSLSVERLPCSPAPPLPCTGAPAAPDLC